MAGNILPLCGTVHGDVQDRTVRVPAFSATSLAMTSTGRVNELLQADLTGPGLAGHPLVYMLRLRSSL